MRYLCNQFIWRNNRHIMRIMHYSCNQFNLHGLKGLKFVPLFHEKPHKIRVIHAIQVQNVQLALILRIKWIIVIKNRACNSSAKRAIGAKYSRYSQKYNLTKRPFRVTFFLSAFRFNQPTKPAVSVQIWDTNGGFLTSTFFVYKMGKGNGVSVTTSKKGLFPKSGENGRNKLFYASSWEPPPNAEILKIRRLSLLRYTRYFMHSKKMALTEVRSTYLTHLTHLTYSLKMKRRLLKGEYLCVFVRVRATTWKAT